MDTGTGWTARGASFVKLVQPVPDGKVPRINLCDTQTGYTNWNKSDLGHKMLRGIHCLVCRMPGIPKERLN